MLLRILPYAFFILQHIRSTPVALLRGSQLPRVVRLVLRPAMRRAIHHTAISETPMEDVCEDQAVRAPVDNVELFGSDMPRASD